MMTKSMVEKNHKTLVVLVGGGGGGGSGGGEYVGYTLPLWRVVFSRQFKLG